MTTGLWQIGLVLLSGAFAGFAPIYIKKGMNNIIKLNFMQIILNINLIIGIVLYGISYLLIIPAFKYGEVSILYPIISLSYIWVCLLSVKLLKEKMTTMRWIGIILIIIGVSFIGLGR
jgi:uncharacterized membrane protein